MRSARKILFQVLSLRSVELPGDCQDRHHPGIEAKRQFFLISGISFSIRREKGFRTKIKETASRRLKIRWPRQSVELSGWKVFSVIIKIGKAAKLIITQMNLKRK
jgi:hypothetical protein